MFDGAFVLPCLDPNNSNICYLCSYFNSPHPPVPREEQTDVFDRGETDGFGARGGYNKGGRPKGGPSRNIFDDV